ncbi:MAG: hypothetical protein M1814_001071 [Vezdaea aestivalis]|nr:MAG: hypothetical protein M1814_001071 [Vezdaea aestivalis]
MLSRLALYNTATRQVAASTPVSSSAIPSSHSSARDQKYTIAVDGQLPSISGPVALTDDGGRRKWTVYIKPGQNFPLKPQVYADICSKAETSGKGAGFVDVAEAETRGPLPGDADFATWGAESPIDSSLPICERSLTYVLEAADAGFGTSLLQLWIAYGLAQKEGRAFFIDDSNWAYGKYTTYFSAPPPLPCRRPSTHHILPCPRQARHLLVSSATALWSFSSSTPHTSLLPSRPSLEPHLYTLARTGYTALFHLQPSDASYASTRLSTLRSTLHPTPSSAPGLLVGLHIRRGDRHPLEYQYAHSYIPLDSYLSSARSLIQETYNGTAHPSLLAQQTASKLVIASDDPDLRSAGELQAAGAQNAQTLILLASKAALDAAARAAGKEKTWVDSTVGWEGGFYRDIFFSLGGGAQGGMQLREYVARAYLLDLAVVGGADRVVCAVSAAGCRVLGVMMGWDRVRGGEWRNVDGEGGWDALV